MPKQNNFLKQLLDLLKVKSELINQDISPSMLSQYQNQKQNWWNYSEYKKRNQASKLQDDIIHKNMLNWCKTRHLSNKRFSESMALDTSSIPPIISMLLQNVEKSSISRNRSRLLAISVIPDIYAVSWWEDKIMNIKFIDSCSSVITAWFLMVRF